MFKKMRSQRRGVVVAAAAAGVLGMLSPAARAETWQGGSGNWSNPAKWDVQPAAGGSPTTALIFPSSDATGYTSTDDLAGAFAFNSITFNNTGTGLITINSSAAANTLAPTTGATISVTGAAAINSIISGTGTLTLGTPAASGINSLTLSGANTFTGGMTLNSGTLFLGADTVATTSNVGFPTGNVTSSPVGTGRLTLSGGTLSVSGGNRSLRNVMTITGTASTIDVGAGLELTTTNTITAADTTNITKTGPGLWRIADGGANNGTADMLGTITINGGTVMLVDTNGVGGDLSTHGIIVNNGGKFMFADVTRYASQNTDLPDQTTITINAGGVVEWYEGEDFGGVVLNGGSLFMGGSGTNNGNINTTVGTELRKGTITLSTSNAPVLGGTGTNAPISKTTADTVTVTGIPITNPGPLIIEAGVLSTDAAVSGGTLNFGALVNPTTAGTLQYRGATTTMPRAIALNIGTGTIDVTNAATVYTLSGAMSGSGNLNKTGPGTIAITGAMTQTGTLTASGGTIRVNPVTVSGGFAVQSGGTLAVNSGAGTATFTTPSLALAGTGATLRFDLTTALVPGVPLMNVTNADGLTRGTGNTTIQITNPNGLVNGSTYQLIDYNGADITSGFTAKLPGRTVGNIIYNTTDTRIDLQITGTDSIIWTGAVNSNWDVGTSADVGGTNNFKLATTSSPTNFIDTDQVLFDDTSSVKTVNLATTVQPGSVTVNTASTYTFQTSSGGSISGSGTLVKQGTGTLILATNNTYTGATTVSAGKLQMGTGGTSGSIGTGPVSIAAGAELIINRSDNITYNGAISGTGTITKEGAGMFIQDSNSNNFTGTLVINGGTFRVADPTAAATAPNFNARSIIVNNGGKFEFFGPTGNPNLPEGAGPPSTAAIGVIITVNSGGVAEFTEGELFGGIVLAGGTFNTTAGLGVTNGNGVESPAVRTDLRSGAINQLPGGTGDINNNGNIRKSTTGTVTITGVPINVTGTIFMEDGVLSTDADIGLATSPTPGAMEFGTTTATPTSGVLQYRGTNGTLRKSININAVGATIDVSQANGVLTIPGVSADGTLQPLPITGSGSLTKTGPGTLTLAGDNGGYGGNINVNGGKLLVSNASGTGSGIGTITVAAGAVLGGSGTIGGNVSITGTLSPGNSAGILTVGGTTTMQQNASYAIELGKVANDANAPVAGTDYDQLSLGGGGTTLTLANTKLLITESGFLKNGQTFVIVDNTAGGTFTGLFANAAGTPLTEGASVFGSFGGRYTIHYDATAGDITLTAVAVPEPASVGLLGAGCGLLLLRRRRSTINRRLSV